MNSKIALALISATTVLTCFSSQAAIATTKTKVPNTLNVPENQALVFNTFAKGVQIYVCEATKVNNQYKWTLKAPEAALFDSKTGTKVGTHYAGPTWEANNGSKVVGKVKNSVKSPDSNSIPWLLLTAKSHTSNGVFSNISYIQRVDTVGGKAPASGCDSNNMGKEARVDYTANYYFYRTTK